MKMIVYKTVEMLLVLLILTTVVHAFYQSSLPPAESTEQSSKVGEIIEEIIPPETPPGAYIQKNLRKLAHFTEFFFLGLWCALFVLLYHRRRWAFSAFMPFGVMIALLDETVQIFSKRGPSVKDIWIDTLGYTVAATLSLLVFFVIALIRLTRERRYL